LAPKVFLFWDTILIESISSMNTNKERKTS